MRIIAITRPSFFDGETALVNELFREGLEKLHLRKPGATEQQLAEWLQDIDPEYLGRIVLHDCHGLVRKFPVGGVHLNSRNPDVPDFIGTDIPEDSGHRSGSRQLTVSRSCHSIAEVQKYKDNCDYLFLSPIYDSISKEGYGAAFSRIDLRKAADDGIIDSKVYALGGVSVEHIPELREFGFGGAAVLGALWQSEDPAGYLKDLLQKASEA